MTKQSQERLKPKIIRACTVSNSISFVDGMLPDLLGKYRVSILASPGEYWDCIDKYGDAVGRISVPMQRHIAPWHASRYDQSYAAASLTSTPK